MARMENILACVFDAYGTLFDVHSAISEHRRRLVDMADDFSVLWRTKQLEYTWLRSLMGTHADFWEVTGDALDYAMDAFSVSDPELRRDLMEAYLKLTCYPEVQDTLKKLKEQGIGIAILSNGSPRMLEAAVSAAGLDGVFDKVISVEEADVYKPDPRVYKLAEERMGVKREEICFLSSNAWDVAGAVSFGLRVVWINRFGQRPERLPFTPEAEITTLDELPPLLGKHE